MEEWKFRVLNYSTNSPLKGKKLVIPTAILPFEIEDMKVVPYVLSKTGCTDSWKKKKKTTPQKKNTNKPPPTVPCFPGLNLVFTPQSEIKREIWWF